MTYPDAIYAICREKAVAVTKVEKDLGWSQGTIRRWEKNTPSIEKIVAVADYLGVSIDAVCGRKTEETIVEKFIAETRGEPARRRSAVEAESEETAPR